MIRQKRKQLRRCRTGWVIIATELDAKIILAQRMYRDKGETRYYPCGNHFHLTSEPENETTSEALTSRVAV